MRRAVGRKYLVNLSSDLRAKLPGVKGLSKTNIGYAKRFYLLYNEYFTIHPQAVGELLDSALLSEMKDNIRWKIDGINMEVTSVYKFV